MKNMSMKMRGDYMMLYEGGEGSGVKGYDLLLPGNLYEMQVY